jgi:hypothetical protein
MVLLALATLPLPGREARAQGLVRDMRNSARVGIGYAVNIPNTFVGFTALGMTPKLLGGAGVYADVKFTTSARSSDPYYLSDVSVQQAEITFGDQFFQEKSDWLSVNFALVYAIHPEVALYGGAGYTRETNYREYFDNTQTRGELGFYWISDPEASGNRVNVLGGAFIRMGQYVMLQLGVEAQPKGVTVGLTFVPF